MPIYLLGAHTRSVEISNEPISVSLVKPGTGAELCVRSNTEQKVVRIGAQALTIPVLTGPATIAVQPADGAEFGHDTTAQLVVSSESGGATDEIDPTQVTFDPVDVSGCRLVELAGLTPHGDRIAVQALASDDTQLGPLASMARTAARRCAGGRRQAHTTRLSIGVDASASMWRPFHDGSVAAAIDLVVGVADAVEIRDITATIVGAEVVHVDVSVSQLAEAVTRAPQRWSAGARWSLLPPTESMILLTDSAGGAGLQRAPAIRMSADSRLAERGPLLSPPPPGVDARQYLTEHPAVVDGIVPLLLREIA